MGVCMYVMREMTLLSGAHNVFSYLGIYGDINQGLESSKKLL